MQRIFKIVFVLTLFFQTALCAMDANPVAESPRYHWAACQFMGSRTAQEDAFCYQPGLNNPPDSNRDPVFGVFDGHGRRGCGAQVSQCAAHTMPTFFAQARADGKDVPSALNYALAEIEKRSGEPQVEESWTQFEQDAGSTAVMVGIDAQDCAHIKNLGDSVCMVLDEVEDEDGSGYVMRCRTRNHSPYQRDEAERIFKAGGIIEYCDQTSVAWKMDLYKKARTWAQLPKDFASTPWKYDYGVGYANDTLRFAVTRVLGDACVKNCGVSAEPESLEPQKIDEKSLVVLMSDGVTDAYADEDIVAKIAHLMAAPDIDSYHGFTKPDCLVGNNARLQHVVRVMGDFVLRQRTDSDNVTLMLIQKAKNQAGESHDEK